MDVALGSSIPPPVFWRENMHSYQKNIAMICIGGGGSNVLNAVLSKNTGLTATMVINRCKKGIKRSQTTEKILLKADTPKQVEEAVNHHRDTICRFLKDKDALILFACMGGFSGTYATPVIASLAKELSLPTLAVITLPFAFEGEYRMKQATAGQSSLVSTGITVATFPNQDLIGSADADTAMQDAFELLDREVLKLIEPYLLSHQPSK